MALYHSLDVGDLHSQVTIQNGAGRFALCWLMAFEERMKPLLGQEKWLIGWVSWALPQLLCKIPFPWGDLKHTSTYSDGELITGQSTLGEPMSFLRVTDRKAGEGYLLGQKWLKGSCATKGHTSMDDSSQKLGTWNTLYSLQTAQQLGECP